MTKKQILETITQQEHAAWTQLKNMLISIGNQSIHDKPLSAPVTRAKEKWSTLYCLLEKLDQ
jgi:hypothetical protein